MASKWEEFNGPVEDAAQEVKKSSAAGNSSFGESIPADLKERIDSWEYGKYGWTSPVNLMVTACWVKWLQPQQDVCKIWSKDPNDDSIAGGFSIRSYEERITVPLVSKHRIYNNFCSSNGGMQGSRAIEKARGAGRLNRNTDLEQRVLFDLPLFLNIMNDINELNSPHMAKATFQYFLEIAFRIRSENETELKKLSATQVRSGPSRKYVEKGISEIKDPQFVKMVVAAVLEILRSHSEMYKSGVLKGVEGAKTGADARSREPGDLWIEVNESPVFACEVKDASKNLGFAILAAIETRLANNDGIETYYFVTAAEQAVDEQATKDPDWFSRIAEIQEKKGCSVLPLSLRELLTIAATLQPLDERLLRTISEFLSVAQDLKNDTIKKWQAIIAAV